MDWSEATYDAPSEDDRLRPDDLGKLARRLRRAVVGVARVEDRPTLTALLRAHLRVPLDDLEVVGESWPAYEHVNVQVGLDAWLSDEDRDHELVGMVGVRGRDFGLEDLLRAGGGRHGPHPGNVAWVNLPAGPGGEVRRAVRAGIYLVTDRSQGQETRAALLLRAADPEYGVGLQLHVVADRAGAAAGVAADVRRLVVEHNVFRGQVLSFGRDMFGERGAVLQFHERPRMAREALVLDPAVLEVVERQVVGVARSRRRLLEARQHLKRGLLLYGPPGVGKTHTVRYLVGRLEGVTVLELTGDALAMIRQACSVARTLQPAMVVVEDVDLIAENRGRYPGEHPLLFELLNEMDGLAEDADVAFVLTTNRADLLEPALAARPGRVDQAVALDLPDREARRRLFALYKGGLDVDESRLDGVLERTEGVTASFVKELLRRAALLAAERDPAGRAPLAVSADDLDTSLDELLDSRNAMTRALLGGRQPDDPVPGAAFLAAGGVATPGLAPPGLDEDDDW
jgi:hypothetical protein